VGDGIDQRRLWISDLVAKRIWKTMQTHPAVQAAVGRSLFGAGGNPLQDPVDRRTESPCRSCATPQVPAMSGLYFLNGQRMEVHQADSH
jgi:hypothetical protein